MFSVGQTRLECMDQYKCMYLGVSVAGNDEFLLAEKLSSLKASRALISIKQSLYDRTIKPSAGLCIFFFYKAHCLV